MNGTEDYIVFGREPAAPEVTYRLSLGERVAGLRLVENTLELLDAEGTPRLRVAPPYLVDAAHHTFDATIALSDCAADTNPAAPWGRTVTPPGATECRVRVSWDPATMVYPHAKSSPFWDSKLTYAYHFVVLAHDACQWRGSPRAVPRDARWRSSRPSWAFEVGVKLALDVARQLPAVFLLRLTQKSIQVFGDGSIEHGGSACARRAATPHR